MFFAPALRNDALTRSPNGLDYGLERFFGDTFRRLGAGFGMQEDDKSWTLSVDVPGVAKEHLQVNVVGNTVRIETAQESARQFKAAYELPDEIDAGACEAKLEHGVLTLRLGKVQSAMARQITVN